MCWIYPDIYKQQPVVLSHVNCLDSGLLRLLRQNEMRMFKEKQYLYMHDTNSSLFYLSVSCLFFIYTKILQPT